MTDSSKYSLAVVVAGISLLVPGLLIAAARVPKVWAPFPVIWVIAVGILGPLALLLPSIGFWISGIGLFKAADRIPLWLTIVIGAVGVLHAAHLASGWNLGLEYQGRAHTVSVITFSALVYGVVLGTVLASRRRRSFMLNFLAQWSFWFWLAWLSFPYLGEPI